MVPACTGEKDRAGRHRRPWCESLRVPSTVTLTWAPIFSNNIAASHLMHPCLFEWWVLFIFLTKTSLSKALTAVAMPRGYPIHLRTRFVTTILALLEKLQHCLADLEVLVNFEWLGSQLQAEGVNVPYKGISKKHCKASYSVSHWGLWRIYDFSPTGPALHRLCTALDSHSLPSA